jgi:hypothetical protein
MDMGVAGQDGEEEREWQLIDATRLSLRELILSNDTVLTNQIRQLKAAMARPQDVIAAFSSSL